MMALTLQRGVGNALDQRRLGRFGPRFGMGLINCDKNSQEAGLVWSKEGKLYLLLGSTHIYERGKQVGGIRAGCRSVLSPGGVFFFIECAMRHGHYSRWCVRQIKRSSPLSPLCLTLEAIEHLYSLESSFEDSTRSARHAAQEFVSLVAEGYYTTQYGVCLRRVDSFLSLTWVKFPSRSRGSFPCKRT